MTPQQFLQDKLERAKFKELLKTAENADLPLHSKAQANEHLQRTFGNKYISQTSVEKASSWFTTILGENNPHKGNTNE